MAGRAYSLLGFLALQKIALAFGISRSGRLSIAVGTALGRPFIVLRLLLHRRCIKGTHKSTCRLRIVLSGLGKRKKFKSVNKDKLLQMAGFGAKMVFSSKDTIADEDIKRIIAKGEEATNELDAKMMKFTEDTIKFIMDDSADLYDFEDENVQR